MPTKKNIADKPTPANKQKGKKVCPCCHDEKNLTQFYIDYSPLFSIDQRTPICSECCKTLSLNKDGTVNVDKLKETLMRCDKPLYYDDLSSAKQSVKKENSFISDDEVEFHGYDILKKYFMLNGARQNRAKSFADSQAEGFMHTNSNKTISEKSEIKNTYMENANNKQEKEELVYSDVWLGDYSEKDIDYLDKYYNGLNRDYKILTENHRDYARKIAKASLQMDKCFNDMINGVDGADVKYKNAREAFDTLSKSAKFSESTRSVNDVGISSFSKITEMVENHNWIPEHKPIEKDEIDKLLDALSTITKSL